MFVLAGYEVRLIPCSRNTTLTLLYGMPSFRHRERTCVLVGDDIFSICGVERRPDVEYMLTTDVR